MTPAENQKSTSNSTAPSWLLDPRVELAAERTLLAWLRTGLALIGFGFVVARVRLFLAELATSGSHQVTPDQNRGSLIMGISLVALGVWVIVVSANRYRHYSAALTAGKVVPPPSAFFGLVVAGFLAVMGVIIVVNLLMGG